MLKRMLVSCTLLMPLPSLANPQMDEAYSRMTEMAKQELWSGNVRGANGKYLTEPPKGEDKTIAYIPDEEASEVIRLGIISGVADNCEMEWKPHYDAIMKHQRALGRNEYQMAYVAVLHGTGKSTMQYAGCIEDLKEKTATQVKENITKLSKKP